MGYAARPAAPAGRSLAVPPRLVLFLLYLGLAACLSSFQAWIFSIGPHGVERVLRHDQIVGHVGEAPWTYRLLVPTLVEATRGIPEGLGWDPAPAIEATYAGWQFVFLLPLLLLFHGWMRAWVDPVWAVAGSLFFVALQGPSYAWYWFQPDSLPDLVAWLGVALLSLRAPGPADGWLFALVLAGALNRETVVFAVGLHLALRWGREAPLPLLARTAALGLCWLAVFLGVRWRVGDRPWASDDTPAEYLADNLGSADWLGYALAFFGVAWIAPLGGWRLAPPALRRAALLMLPYLALQLLFGRIREVRLLLPLALVLVPMGALWLRRALTPPEAR